MDNDYRVALELTSISPGAYIAGWAIIAVSPDRAAVGRYRPRVLP